MDGSLEQKALLPALSPRAHSSCPRTPCHSPLINQHPLRTLRHLFRFSLLSLGLHSKDRGPTQCVGSAAQVRCPTTGACLVPGASPYRRLLLNLLVPCLPHRLFSVSCQRTTRTQVSNETRQKVVDFQKVLPSDLQRNGRNRRHDRHHQQFPPASNKAPVSGGS